MISPARKGSYGIDAPYVPLLMTVGWLVCVALMIFAHMAGLWISALILALIIGFYMHTTLRGKFVAWRQLLHTLQWRGDERILDLGCGRGAVLLMAAECVPRGHAVGIDIWRSKDQSGNAMDTTRRNAVAEGVADRIELETADMRELPFADASFDVIVSNVAIHNISDAGGRDRAIDEAWRVLRPGGRLLIADISKSRQYHDRLATLGARVDRRTLGWRMWWGGPWMATMLIDVQKPA